MDFDSYMKIAIDSVQKQGYDNFYPSLCVVKDSELQFDVLETELTEEGEKEITLEWTYPFTSEGQTLFSAYRVGNREIEVVQILGAEVIRKSRISVKPYQEDE